MAEETREQKYNRLINGEGFTNGQLKDELYRIAEEIWEASVRATLQGNLCIDAQLGLMEVATQLRKIGNHAIEGCNSPKYGQPETQLANLLRLVFGELDVSVVSIR